ncbi:MAG TPA: SGNH/GDSL hydrolase family protein [Methyloceanibacter sp.]|nr:SGNH/GDSL hydrolase family protein [Methyloceanibacter sp.]
MTDETPRPSRRKLLAGAALIAGAGAWPVRGEEQAAMKESTKHVVLLGDSIFDNKAYVGSGPDVIAQLRAALPQGSIATLAAVDGSTTADVRQQLGNLPKDATHLIVSAGGNDALEQRGVLQEWSLSIAGALDKLSKIKSSFGKSYAAMLNAVTARGLPTAVCTIYDARYQDLELRRIAAAGLTVFNDVILREAFARALPVIDLRIMFDDDADYANDIEPSVKGGEKIARAIAALVETHDFTRRRSEIYVE